MEDGQEQVRFEHRISKIVHKESNIVIDHQYLTLLDLKAVKRIARIRNTYTCWVPW